MLALFLLVGYAANFFFLVFGGIIFAVVISALGHFVSDKTSLSYSLSVALVLVLLTTLIGGTIWLLAPVVSQQADELATSLPKAFDRLRRTLSQTKWGQKLLAGIPENPGKLLSSDNLGKGVLSQLTGVFSTTLGGLVNILIVVITGIYLASSPDTYRKGFVKLFNPSYRDRLLGVMDQCYDTLKNWFISRSITMTVVGIVTGIGLAILGVPFAIVLGILAGILNFIPNLGPYIALAPALLVALPQGMSAGALRVRALHGGTVPGGLRTDAFARQKICVPATRPAAVRPGTTGGTGWPGGGTVCLTPHCRTACYCAGTVHKRSPGEVTLRIPTKGRGC